MGIAICHRGKIGQVWGSPAPLPEVAGNLRSRKAPLWTSTTTWNKKLSCRRETARRFVSLNILLSHSRSFEMTRACVRVRPYSFIETMSVCRTVYELFSVKEWRDLETGGRGRSRSLKMALFDRSYTTFYCRPYSCMLYHFQVIWRWIIIVILKRSLKVIQTSTIRKLGCGFLFAFYSNYGRIFNRLWDTQRQSIGWPCELG